METSNLIILTGAKRGTVCPVEDQAVIGRSHSVGVRLPDFLVSQEHAKISRTSDGYQLEDLSSTNGTYHNGARVRETILLVPGDVVHVGTTGLLFTDREELDPSVWKRAGQQAVPDFEGEEGPRSSVHISGVKSGKPGSPGLTLFLPLVHQVERAFSRATDLRGLLERIAVHFARSTGGREVAIVLEREGTLEVEFRGVVEGVNVELSDTLTFDLDMLRDSVAESTNRIRPRTGPARTLYMPLETPNGVVGGIAVQPIDETFGDEQIPKLAMLASLAAVHCNNQVLVEELRVRNEELEDARSQLASWNESLQAAVEQRTADLLRSEQSYRELFSESRDANVTCDRSGRLQTLNRRAEEIFAATRKAEALCGLLGGVGSQRLGLPQPASPTGFAAWLDQLVSTPLDLITFPYRDPANTADDTPASILECSVRPIVRDGHAEGLHAVVRDVTRRMRAEAHNRLLSRIVENVPEAVLSVDLDGQVTSWNAGAESLFGFKAAETVGEILPTVPDSKVAEFERFLDAARNGRSAEQRTVRVDRRDREHPVQVTVAPVPNSRGEVVGMVEIGRDLSEQLKLEERIRYSERMASFGSLAAGLAHELGNPLANLLAGIGYMRVGTRDPQETNEVLGMLHEETSRLRRLVQSALDLARWRSPELESVALREDLFAYLQSTLDLRAREQGVSISIHMSEEISLWVDTDQMKQALLNLRNTALSAMPEGGDLSLRGDVFGTWAQLEVCDTGKGIYPEDMERVFDLFFSRSEGGTGIGLAVVKRVVDAHRGRIDVESRRGEGTTFRIELPLEPTLRLATLMDPTSTSPTEPSA